MQGYFPAHIQQISAIPAAPFWPPDCCWVQDMASHLQLNACIFLYLHVQPMPTQHVNCGGPFCPPDCYWVPDRASRLQLNACKHVKPMPTKHVNCGGPFCPPDRCWVPDRASRLHWTHAHTHKHIIMYIVCVLHEFCALYVVRVSYAVCALCVLCVLFPKHCLHWRRSDKPLPGQAWRGLAWLWPGVAGSR